MEYTQLASENLKISSVGLGTWVFSGDSWGEADERQCLDAVAAALDHGINLIDTAPIYGFGRAEEVVGKAIRGKREKVFLATKCGLLQKGKGIESNLSNQSIRKEIEQSLKRLQVDYIDLYQCHWPDPKTPLEETMETLMQLKQEGKLRYIGVSNFDLTLLRKSVDLADVVSLQSQYSILDRSLEEVLPFCQERGVGFLAYGVLGGGILSGKYKQPAKFQGADARNFFYKYYQGEAFTKVQSILASLEKLKKPLNQIALNWVRQSPAVSTVLVGCRNAQQVIENVKAADWELSEEEISQINALKI